MSQHSQPLDLAEALSRLTAQIQPLGGTETVALTAARHRVLAATIYAPTNMPPFPASAMDGYAVRQAAWQETPTAAFTLVGESLAGHPFDAAISERQAVRIFTGAALPDGADLVLLQEEVASCGPDSVTFNPHTIAETYVRPIGHDMSNGQQLVTHGTVVSPLVQGLLAAAGIGEVTVTRKPRVGVFSSGDELVEPGIPPAALAAGQIYDSNRLTVLSLLADLPVELSDLGRLADHPQAVTEALAEASAKCDMLITSGGVSVGDADFITATIRRLGKLSFWRLNLKPGKPLAYGRLGACHIFGLPGNPVSTIVTLLLIAKPALMHLCGANSGADGGAEGGADSGADGDTNGISHSPLRVSATTTVDILHKAGRAEYQRGILRYADSKLTVALTGDQSSNRMTTFAEANCLVEIPKELHNVPAGTVLQALPFRGLL